MHLAITRSYSRTFLRKHLAATIWACCRRNAQTPAVATCWSHATPTGPGFVLSRNYAQGFGGGGSSPRGPFPPGGMHRMDMGGK